MEIWPDVGRVVLDTYTDVAAGRGQPVFPFAWYEDGSSDAVLAEDGRVFLLHPTATFRLGADVCEAVTGLVRGTRWPEVDGHGDPLPQ